MPELSPQDIENRSLAIIEAETPRPRPYGGHQWEIVRRMIHASADFELLELVRFHPNAVSAGVAALREGCLVVTDTEMGRAGIPARRLLALKAKSACFIGDPGVSARAVSAGRTRSVYAVDKALEQPQDKIFVIGNAPTALMRLLERIDGGAPPPALIVGMPVGFVNAAQSKELLMARSDVAYITVAGRKGGTALACAALNALAEIALRRDGE
ncbi:MAG: precorrin-8X methylmutase [Desulfovibrionaceae bacterium]|nr:precorrin-8X methylmutase [Desulfovibrionaceae bacterium]MBF0514038.1 precorrin-8X methylmutase [Desulfovibrionaceae bacterium]